MVIRREYQNPKVKENLKYSIMEKKLLNAEISSTSEIYKLYLQHLSLSLFKNHNFGCIAEQ